MIIYLKSLPKDLLVSSITKLYKARWVIEVVTVTTELHALGSA